MARDYFLQTTSLVPPRGVRVEMTEIKPLRPNQATILPGVAVMGQGMKFEVNMPILRIFGNLNQPFLSIYRLLTVMSLVRRTKFI